MKNREIIILLAVLILLVVGNFIYKTYKQNKIDNLVSCLKQKNVIFYGASWCPHCAEQKRIFGNSAKNLTYFECSNKETEPQKEDCNKVGIKKYPTWIFDGKKKIEGVANLGTLSREASCGIDF